jgi:hypothetical protein
MRLRGKKGVRGRQTMIEPGNHGAIVYEIDNLGRHLILVEWNDDSSVYVFPDEIEITDMVKSPQSCEQRREPCL